VPPLSAQTPLPTFRKRHPWISVPLRYPHEMAMFPAAWAANSNPQFSILAL